MENNAERPCGAVRASVTALVSVIELGAPPSYVSKHKYLTSSGDVAFKSRFQIVFHALIEEGSLSQTPNSRPKFAISREDGYVSQSFTPSKRLPLKRSDRCEVITATFVNVLGCGELRRSWHERWSFCCASPRA